jgi:hypothetical protein
MAAHGIMFAEPQILLNCAPTREGGGWMTSGLGGIKSPAGHDSSKRSGEISRSIPPKVTRERQRPQGREIRQGDHRGQLAGDQLPFMPDDPRVVIPPMRLRLRQVPNPCW